MIGPVTTPNLDQELLHLVCPLPLDLAGLVEPVRGLSPNRYSSQGHRDTQAPTTARWQLTGESTKTKTEEKGLFKLSSKQAQIACKSVETFGTTHFVPQIVSLCSSIVLSSMFLLLHLLSVRVSGFFAFFP